MSEPILIWGAGAIGGTLGALFIRAGHDVLFVDSAADHVAAINAAGLGSPGRSRTTRQGAGFRAGGSRRAVSTASSCA